MSSSDATSARLHGVYITSRNGVGTFNFLFFFYIYSYLETRVNSEGFHKFYTFKFIPNNCEFCTRTSCDVPEESRGPLRFNNRWLQ